MDETPTDWSPFQDLLGDSDLPTIGFRAVAYLKPDGSPGMAWGYELNGKAIGYQVIGLVEGAKLELFKQLVEDLDED